METYEFGGHCALGHSTNQNLLAYSSGRLGMFVFSFCRITVCITKRVILLLRLRLLAAGVAGLL